MLWEVRFTQLWETDARRQHQSCAQRIPQLQPEREIGFPRLCTILEDSKKQPRPGVFKGTDVHKVTATNDEQ